MSVIRAGVVAALLFASASAAAQEADDAKSDKAECVALLDRAQSLHTARKLRDARASYIACAAATCPDLVREDCTRSLVTLDAAMPTIVFSARSDGHDVTDARVLLDGEAISSALDGRSVPLDPGSHVARFERSGGGAVEVRLVAREGEKNRAVAASFIDTKPAEKPRSESGRVPVLPILLGGTGLMALGGSFYVRLDAAADAADLRRSCAPQCDSSSRDALSDKLIVANVALGVGIGALALAAATWLFDPRR